MTELTGLMGLTRGAFQNPAHPGFVPSGSAQGAQVAQAGQQGYAAQMANANAQNQSSNGFMSGLMGIAGSALGGLLSDPRLKENIVRIGIHSLGIGLYAWDYLWGEHSTGVMADEVLEVMPEAVSYTDDGYMMVNYAMVGRQ
jgi:hypothetical protein